MERIQAAIQKAKEQRGEAVPQTGMGSGMGAGMAPGTVRAARGRAPVAQRQGRAGRPGLGRARGLRSRCRS